MKVFIDIETIPQQPEEETKAEIEKTIEAPAAMKKAETIAAWHNGSAKYEGAKDAAVEKAYRDTSFDGGKGEIISIAWSIEGDEVASQHRNLGDSEFDLIQHVFDIVVNAKHDRPPFFIGQFVAGFDLKFLYHRCVILGVKPPFKLPFNGRHDKDFYCTQEAWAGFKGRMSQDNLCKALGIDGKPDDIDGSKVWDFVKAGNIARVAEYNRDDVEKNIKIYNRLNFKG